jgi:hypothetical protein
MRIAFKEWAVIVDTLGRGEQIVVLRKGGISEGPGGFQVEHPAFFFFPTLYHQQGESVLPAVEERFRKRFHELVGEMPGPATIRIEYHAQVISWRKIESLEMARQLHGQHVWKDEVIAQRFAWGKDRNIFALALRVSKLAQPAELPMSPAYGGCKSWVELERDLETDESQPVLSDEAFRERLEFFRQALGRVPQPGA